MIAVTPSHARKGGMKYRHYLSSALLHGAADQAGSVRRVSAAEIEALVIKTLREHLEPCRRSKIGVSSMTSSHALRSTRNG
jgi:hypothetical protein